MVFLQPIGKARRAVPRKWSHQRQHGARDCNFVSPGEGRGSQEGQGRMERRGQSRWTNFRTPAAGLDEGETIEPLNLAGDSDAAVKVEQVGAASEQHMLTVIYSLARSWMFVGRGATADERPALEQADLESCFGQSASCSKPGDASANDSYGCMFFLVIQSVARLDFQITKS